MLLFGLRLLRGSRAPGRVTHRPAFPLIGGEDGAIHSSPEAQYDATSSDVFFVFVSDSEEKQRFQLSARARPSAQLRANRIPRTGRSLQMMPLIGPAHQTCPRARPYKSLGVISRL